MSSSDWEKTPSSKMFKTLYKYIIGLNEDNKEIEMTRPGKNSSHAYTNFESTNLHFFLLFVILFYKVQIFTSDQNRQKKNAKKTIQKRPFKTFRGTVAHHRKLEEIHNLEMISTQEDLFKT